VIHEASKPRLSRRRLGRTFYRRSAVVVARDLIGRVLVHESDGVRLSGRILEAEAYHGPSDRACHASRGRTPRTEPMFWAGGVAYIYLVYGMHLCFNVVTGKEDFPSAVLIRALEPLQGLEHMARRAPRSKPGDLCRGPGRLSRALALRREQDRSDLCSRGLHLEEGAPVPRRLIACGPRIGVDYAGAWALKPWRLGWLGHPGLSRPF
jgi:DNA-3-methyladenine glycosylase